MSPASRSLRIGVVLNGQLVEERIFRSGTSITFGQSLRCALAIPSDAAPREHTLFAVDEGGFRLRTLPNMSARLGIGDRVEVLDGERELAIARGTRGKLMLGDLVILFQDIATPPPAPRPTLPASIRGSFADRIDRRLAIIIGASLCVHVAIAAWAWSEDRDLDVLGQPSVADYRNEIIDITLPDHVERVDPTNLTPAQKPAVAQPVTPPTRIVPPRTPGHAAASDPQQLAEDASRMASILTGTDGTNGFGGMSHRTPGADLNRQIDDARNRTITIGENRHTSRTNDRANIGTGPHDPLIPGPDTQLTRTDHTDTERPIRFPLTPEPQPPDQPKTTLTAQMVLDRINSLYMNGLVRCYRLGLNEDGSLSGKIHIELTVDERGKVIDPSASGLAPKVDSCVQGFMTSWRFPIPRDKAGNPTEQTFKVSVLMRNG